MKPELRLKHSFEGLGLSANKVSERLTEAGYCISKHMLYETMREQKNRTKCAKLARAMAFQNNEETKLRLWTLFKAA